MNRIDKLLQEKKENILSVYFTAGYPNLNDTVETIKTLDASGADLIEIGMPFSDPLADGVVIQQSSQVALGNGMSLKVLFEQIKDIRQETEVPLILMGYINPVLKYGVEDFCKKCQEIGVDGLIIPDLPMYEYEEIYKPIMEQAGLYNIFLITPQTSDERIRKIDGLSKGFIYLVSSASTTGAKSSIANDQEAYFKRIKDMELDNPCLIGFGISDHKTFSKACDYAAGGIIGSAFIKAVSKEGELTGKINTFAKNIIG